MNASRTRSFLIFAIIIAAAVYFGIERVSQAQPGGGVKLGGTITQTKKAFEGLLGKYGDGGMLLEVQIRVAGPNIDKVEVLGKFVDSTDSFLVVKLQNQRDLVFIPWEHVLYITGRPN